MNAADKKHSMEQLLIVKMLKVCFRLRFLDNFEDFFNDYDDIYELDFDEVNCSLLRPFTSPHP